MGIENLWVEKYRPNKLEDVVLTDQQRELFTGWLEKGEVPHTLFWGGPGTGKTTVARILIGNIDAELLKLNASSERGIDTVRDKIREFARTSPFKKWKIVFLDEADGLTFQAQQTLRGTIEEYANTCRFILTANYVEKIIDAMQSRMLYVKFEGLATKDIYQLLSKILEAEKVEFQEDDVLKVMDDAGGDLRMSINMLQSMVRSGKVEYQSNKDRIDVIELWEATKEKKWPRVREMLDYGIDSHYVLEKVFEYVWEQSPQIAVEYVGEYLFRDAIVVNKKLNVLCCLVEVSRYLF